MQRTRFWASYALITTPRGVMMIREPAKSDPHYWRLPGGGKDVMDFDELDTLRRELYEELFLHLEYDNAEVKLVHYFKQGEVLGGYSRPTALYTVHFEDPRWYRQRGPGGEVVRVFPFAQLPRESDIFPPQLKMLRAAKIWPTRAPARIAA